MIKQIKKYLSFIIFLALSQPVFAARGTLFNVAATGTPANVSITLCLNGQSQLSCQNYTVSALNLLISTTLPNHAYPAAGIKINTSGYVFENCIPGTNGYCLFSTSNSTPKAITLKSILSTASPLLLVTGNIADMSGVTNYAYQSINNGATWTASSLPAATSETYFSSTAGSNGTFILGGYVNGTPPTTPYLYYGSGSGWTTAASTPQPGNIYQLTNGNNLFMAIVDMGTGFPNAYHLWTGNANGTTWTDALTLNASNTITIGITYGNSYYVALLEEGSGQNTYVYYSNCSSISACNNSGNWNAYTTTMAANMHDLTYGNGMMMAVGVSNTSQSYAYYVTTTQLAQNTDPWSSTQIGGSSTFVTTVTYGKTSSGVNEFVAMDTNWNLYTSTDGTSWTTISDPFPSHTGQPQKIRYNSAKGFFIVIGNNSQIFTSTDLMTWTPGVIAGVTPGITFTSTASSL